MSFVSIWAAFTSDPVIDPIRALVVFGTGQDVDTVYVDGQQVVADGAVINADEDALRQAAPAIQQQIVRGSLGTRSTGAYC